MPGAVLGQERERAVVAGDDQVAAAEIAEGADVGGREVDLGAEAEVGRIEGKDRPIVAQGKVVDGADDGHADVVAIGDWCRAGAHSG